MSINGDSKNVTGTMNARVNETKVVQQPQQIGLDIGTVGDKVAMNLTGTDTVTKLPIVITLDTPQAYQVMAAIRRAIDTVESNQK